MAGAQPKGLLEASNQTRKLGRAVYLILGATAVWYVADQDWVDPIYRLVVLSAAALVGVIGTFYALYSVRCPKCNLRWVSWSLRHQSHGQWLHWLYEFTECPQCKHRAS
jgi:hypothetical protein